MITTAGQVADPVATFVERTIPRGEGGPVYGGQVRAIILAICSITEMESDIRRRALDEFCYDD